MPALAFLLDCLHRIEPLDAPEAVDVIRSYRRHPNWMVLGFDPDSAGLHEELWGLAAEAHFGRRRIHDARLASRYADRG
jgi:hypothetical protein